MVCILDENRLGRSMDLTRKLVECGSCLLGAGQSNGTPERTAQRKPVERFGDRRLVICRGDRGKGNPVALDRQQYGTRIISEKWIDEEIVIRETGAVEGADDICSREDCVG